MALSRRQFLGAAAAAGSACLATNVRAIEPISRTGTPKFKFSLAAYSYREYLPSTRGKETVPGKKGNLSLEDFITDCAKFGLDGTELTSYYFPKETTPEYLRSLSSLCFKLGLDVTGTAVGNDLTLPKGEKRDEQIALVKRWVDNSAILGAPVIRIFSGHVQKGQTEAEAHALAVEGIEECCDYAGKHGVFLALENHGGLTERPEGLLKLVKDVKSPWFGVNFDSGNFRSPDPYADLEQIAPYAINAQVKVVVSRGDRATAKKEPSDFKRLAKILRDAGYRGYVVLEYEEGDDPRSACPKFLDELRAAFA
jgi:sugar phosphate isomerase/epimerase